MAWLMLMISSREKLRRMPAEMSSPMLSMRMAAWSSELTERSCTGRALISLLEPVAGSAGWVEVSFIAAYPVLDDFRNAFRVVLGEHLQVLDLQFQARARRREANFRERVQLTEHMRTIAVAMRASQRRSRLGLDTGRSSRHRSVWNRVLRQRRRGTLG